MARIIKHVPWLCIFAVFSYAAWLWETSLGKDSIPVIYFGRPGDALAYTIKNYQYLFSASVNTLMVALFSLLFAFLITAILLAVGLLYDGWLRRVELVAAWSQVVPFLVIATITLLIERWIFARLSVEPGTGAYSLLPVTISLLFPPLVYGANGIIRMQIELKALLRLWNPPRLWRIRSVYFPVALPDILTGLRTSATWAVGATLISDGLIDGVATDQRTLGHLLMRPYSSNNADGQVLAVIVISTSLALAVYLVVVWIQLYTEHYLHGSAADADKAFLL